MSQQKCALVTGVAGQDGRLLSRLLLSSGYRVIGTHRGIERSQFAEASLPAFVDAEVCLSDREGMARLLCDYRPDEIYNLAASSTAGGQWESAEDTVLTNGLAVIGLLESILEYTPEARFCQASSCEMFGRVAPGSTQSEDTPVCPETPYAISKALAHHAVIGYRSKFDLHLSSAILFSHSSELRDERFFLGKLARSVAEIAVGQRDYLRLHSLEGQRDWGYAGDYVDAMVSMARSSRAADYVVATGRRQSIREACDLAFSHVSLDYRDYVVAENSSPDIEDISYCGSPSRLTASLGWRPRVTFEQMIIAMVDEQRKRVTR